MREKLSGCLNGSGLERFVNAVHISSSAIKMDVALLSQFIAGETYPLFSLSKSQKI